MASGISDFGANTWIQAAFGVGPVPTNYWLALAYRLPGENVDGTMLATVEVVGGAYTRMSIGIGSTNWIATGSRSVANKNNITFPTATSDWGNINSWVLCTHQTAGDVFAFGDVPQSTVIRTGGYLRILPGGLVMVASSQNETVSG